MHTNIERSLVYLAQIMVVCTSGADYRMEIHLLHAVRSAGLSSKFRTTPAGESGNRPTDPLQWRPDALAEARKPNRGQEEQERVGETLVSRQLRLILPRPPAHRLREGDQDVRPKLQPCRDEGVLALGVHVLGALL